MSDMIDRTLQRLEWWISDIRQKRFHNEALIAEKEKNNLNVINEIDTHPGFYKDEDGNVKYKPHPKICLLYTSPSPRD